MAFQIPILHDWDDYKDVDVRGKLLVILDGVLHVGTRSPLVDMGAAYYGRQLFKFEEAASRGASSALIIYNTETSGFSWDFVARSNHGEYLQLSGEELVEATLPLEGWITPEAANWVFEAGSQELDYEVQPAQEANFEPVFLPVRASVQ